MNEDDRLADILRSEIPEPANDYWETIDAGLANDVDMPTTHTSSPGRWLLAAAALLLPMAAGAWFLSQSNEPVITETSAQDRQTGANNDEPSGSNSETEPVAAPEPVEEPEQTGADTEVVTGSESIEVEPPGPGFIPDSRIVGPSCYQGSDISEGLVVRFTIDASGAASALTYTDVNGTVYIDDAVGYLVADDTAAMSVTPIEPDRDRYTALWYFSSESISLAEDVAASIVDCRTVSTPIAEAQNAIEAKSAVAQPTSPAALNAGRHCFANDGGHPGADYVRIDVDESSGVTAETRSHSDRQAPREERAILPADGIVEVASGVFSTDVDILVRVIQMSGEQTTERFDYWKVIDDGDALQMSQFQFKNRRVPCGEIEKFFDDQ